MLGMIRQKVSKGESGVRGKQMRNAFKMCCLFLFLLSHMNSAFGEGAKNMKAVMIIASSDFRDEELFDTKEVLEKGGVEVTIASSSLSPSRGMLGKIANPQILFGNIKVPDYGAVIFVGGGGASEYWDNATAHTIARETVSSGKILGAICIAPVTLANAGVLKGKKATVWPSEGKKLLKDGANYTGKDVQIDSNIVTANGPKAAKKFGKTILRLLSK